ncbi:MAG TPA: hypothetical protein VED40_05675 [Azospirillaceae bacterium]|nr:hypothetical protein [Azospirillaceae bacterium]
MQIDSSAAYASSINLLSARSQQQVSQLKQASEQQAASTEALLGAQQQQTQAAPTGGRGQVVDIKA